jgi:hypothetical protein
MRCSVIAAKKRTKGRKTKNGGGREPKRETKGGQPIIQYLPAGSPHTSCPPEPGSRPPHSSPSSKGSVSWNPGIMKAAHWSSYGDPTFAFVSLSPSPSSPLGAALGGALLPIGSGAQNLTAINTDFLTEASVIL